MAEPRVFVSSTCYDLSEVRNQLQKFIESFGFIPRLSDKDGVTYRLDEHTHDSCIREVEHSDMFILIIGSRSGSAFEGDKSKSITNAEYDKAREIGIPIYPFVLKQVHHYWQMFDAQPEDKKSLALQLDIPGIQSEDVEKIFRFISSVRSAAINNAVFEFDSFGDIERTLRSQWAGLFFEFLKSKAVTSQMEVTNTMLANLQTHSEKLEIIVKSLYRSVKPEQAELEIDRLSSFDKAFSFYTCFIDIFASVGSRLDSSPSNYIDYCVLVEKVFSIELYDSLELYVEKVFSYIHEFIKSMGLEYDNVYSEENLNKFKHEAYKNLRRARFEVPENRPSIDKQDVSFRRELVKRLLEIFDIRSLSVRHNKL